MRKHDAVGLGHEAQVVGVGVEPPCEGLLDDIAVLVEVVEHGLAQGALVRLVGDAQHRVAVPLSIRDGNSGITSYPTYTHTFDYA